MKNLTALETGKHRQRNTNIDYLRLLAIFLIMMHHTYLWMQPNYAKYNVDLVTQLISVALGSWGKIGVDIFMLISGYFLFSKGYKWTRAVNFVARTYVIAVLIGILGILFANQSKSSALLLAISPIFPLEGTGWWYVTGYAVVLVAFPAVNRVFATVNQKTIKNSLVIIFLLMSVLPFLNLSTQLPGEKTSAVWMLYVYAIGAYIGKFVSIKDIKLKQLWLYLLGATVLLIMRFAAIIWHPGILYPILEKLDWIRAIPWYDSDPILLIIGVLVFLIALSSPMIPMGRVFKLLAGETLGMYMIHNSNAFADQYRLVIHELINWKTWSGLQLVGFEVGMAIFLFVFSALFVIIISPLEKGMVKLAFAIVGRRLKSAKVQENAE